ncbi:aminoglycoside phosphotransferase family protein [Actinoplanes sp. CA-030573]|uniref:aminoglycoside phosphotransferase family protein n=1 Tax=Actinoplanes sp. CA-030573 TaxID=3239898 RepID=UPI003D8F70B5
MKLHHGELDITGDLVRRLLAAQFPAWAGLPLTPVASGTENLMIRLGEDMVVRLPRMPGAVTAIRKEHRWLPFLAPRVPLEVPVPLGLGSPGPDFPLPWAIYRWLPGRHDITDLPAAAAALGGFVAALHKADPAGAPAAYRGGSYVTRDGEVRAELRDLAGGACGGVDLAAAAARWEAALRLPAWDGPPVWLHSDLLPPNLLGRGGALAAVIDFGCAGVGDPAADLMAAWTVFDAASRPIFRDAVGDVDDDTWERGRAWALVFGLGAWHYYRRRKPDFAALGRRTVNQTLTP